ncbi:MAG: class I SAM-dependent methyltransferase [Candidatus Sericytochromatia bacterium]|nr:class I SAM-dependent methyltransferase [Candidatus Sericytochromatia bacterium]
MSEQAVLMPWDVSQPQPAIQALAEAEQMIGDVLDLGCGTGENGLMLASRGHMVWGIDASESAISQARQKAAERELEATFIVGDALNLTILGEGFHTVIDSGLFHFFSDAEREVYLAGLRHVMFSDSRLFLLCLSDREAADLGAHGPRRIQRSTLRKCFSAAQGFKVLQIEPAEYLLNTEAGSAKAWLAVIQRLE